MNTDKKIKLIGTITGIALFIALIVGLSYAWFTWRSSNVNISGTTECFDIHYTNGQTLTNASTILFDESTIISNNKITIKNGMAITDVTAYIDNSCNISANLEITLNVTDLNSAYISGNSIGAFKYVLARYDPSVYSDITTTALNGISFDIIKNESITSTGQITLVDEALSKTEKGYLLIFYVDGDLAMNDAQNSTFTATITGVATQVESSGTKLIDHITNLYTNASKTVVTNNGIDYNYATSVRLMNDRLGDSEVDADSGNIRYYGADDENLKNYIYFNCSDYSSQSSSTCETWRIIGIVDGKVKLIRSSSLGNYSWDYTATGEYDNNWSDAKLNTLLNTTYYNSGSTTYYNGSTSGTSVSFASNGITAATRNNNLISESTWYTNGMSDYDIYANVSYKGERTGTSTYPSNIGLAYPSDYGYSADLNTCTNKICNYDAEECTSVNWLTTMFTTDDWYWLITPNSDDSDRAWRVFYYGCVYNEGLVDVSGGVVPVLYLNSELIIESGTDGSSTNPYRLVVEDSGETAIETITN